ncbi:MAG: hypothetical protein HY879_00835 [Deltaproteobacteria bacterium]|nr:hypothetical protein [Deltaproteobacteria bacterium]
MKRPSDKEIIKRIKEAQEAVADGRIGILNQEATASDALELGYLVKEELKPVLSELLGLISPDHYVGTRPPQRSYERIIKDLELFAFEVISLRFKCPIYFKFALSTGVLWLVSLHKSRQP